MRSDIANSNGQIVYVFSTVRLSGLTDFTTMHMKPISINTKLLVMSEAVYYTVSGYQVMLVH